MLSIENLTIEKGGKNILDHITLTFETGEIHSLLGRNGTGKSTLGYTLMGLPDYRPAAGKILWNDIDITSLDISERAQLGITLAWQEPARFEGLTVSDYLSLSMHHRTSLAASHSVLTPADCLQRVGLDPDAYMSRMLDETLSGGERKRIELAAILAMQPALAILDEPDSGIDSLSIDFIKQVILTLVSEGATILLITHHAVVAEIADRSSVLCAGQLLKTGRPEDIARFFSNHCRPCRHVNIPD